MNAKAYSIKAESRLLTAQSRLPKADNRPPTEKAIPDKRMAVKAIETVRLLLCAFLHLLAVSRLDDLGTTSH
jgi:hypothetical protein